MSFSKRMNLCFVILVVYKLFVVSSVSVESFDYEHGESNVSIFGAGKTKYVDGSSIRTTINVVSLLSRNTTISEDFSTPSRPSSASTPPTPTTSVFTTEPPADTPTRFVVKSEQNLPQRPFYEPSIKALNSNLEKRTNAETIPEIVCTQEKCGQPLFISPFLKVNDIEGAVEQARVRGHRGLESVRSYSGFLTVDNVSNGNTFFWFIPAMDSETSSPIIVWLQGGPGESGLFGLFNLHGPFCLNENLEVERRNYTWAESLNMLYLDNPFGVGFSFTDSASGYPKAQEQVVEYLYSALNQFFTLFPDYKDDHIYISGEGYGAKFAVSLANKIHKMGRDTTLNLKGVALGNPKLDPENLCDHGQYLYELGIIDEEQLDAITARLSQSNYQMRHYAWMEAMTTLELVFGNPYEQPVDKSVYLPELTGLDNDINILEYECPEHFNRYLSFIQKPEVRKAIHVGDKPYQDGHKAYKALRDDIPQTVRNWFSTILDNYRVLFYGGNLGPQVPYSLSRNILQNIHWRHKDDYRNSTRMIWKVARQDTAISGYVHHVKNFFEVMIRNAGHFVSYDQPRAALDMMNRFIWGRAFLVSQKA